MSFVEVRDHSLWIKHIHGNEDLQRRLHALKAGELVKLTVNGFTGLWKKMDDGRDKNSTPTPGIKPIGPARDRWHELQDRRGELVSIKEARK